jgi:hypothetical protein
VLFLLPMAERDAEGLVDAWRDVPADDPGVAHAKEQLARVRAIGRRLGYRNAFEEMTADAEVIDVFEWKRRHEP